MATIPHSALQKLPDFTDSNDLASEQVGGKVVFATDDWFAPAENLIKEEAAVFKEGEITEYGMWMDGWETRRKRTEGHDWCIIQLGVPGVISGIDVDTSYFTGNYAPRSSVQAANLTKSFSKRGGERIGLAATQEDYQMVDQLQSESWEYIVSLTQLQPGFQTSCHNYFECTKKKKFTHIRLNIYPDGGVARLRVYGQAAPNWNKVSEKELVDLASMRSGCVCVGFSTTNRGHPKNLIKPGRGESIKDGWEIIPKATRPTIVQEYRHTGKLCPSGSEWCTFQLGHSGIVQMVEVDTNHYKGNFPYTCKVEGCLVDDRVFPGSSLPLDTAWKTLLPETKLKGHNQMFVDVAKLSNVAVISHVRLTVSPDGGVSRFRIWGRKAQSASSKL
ncbi:allantoicase-like [Mercenaria mercenaria]|uniref:allantoicase-like n=1 Tax=Mercenaria mercenaria TaxID=6596 RepID=UPI00234F9333|nr:allantoicase-like [Mercenaria mercenaria]XP_053406836.1 allantoicase-like [Mercenaria mercenaria]